MFSYGLSFDIEGTDELIEQTRQLRDIYSGLKRDFQQNDDDSIPHFNVYLRAEIRQSENGPKIRFEVMNRASVTAALRDRKEKIEKLLNGIDTLTLTASKLEFAMNSPNNIVSQ